MPRSCKLHRRSTAQDPYFGKRQRSGHLGEGKYLKQILKILRSIGEGESNARGETSGGAYEIHHQVLNTNEHGVPQSRPRWYCVGIRKDVAIMTSAGSSIFRFPSPFRCPSIEEFLDAASNTQCTEKSVAPSRTAHRNIQKARSKIKASGDNPRCETLHR